MNSKSGKIMRVIALVLMGTTAIFTLLGGVGTACVAWNASFYPPFKMFTPYMPTMQLLVYISVFAAMLLLVSTYALVRGDKWSWLGSVILLAIGMGAAAYQMYVSSTLRYTSFFNTAPTNMRFYISLITLVYMLVIRIPTVWQKVDLFGPWRGKGSRATGGGLAALMAGIVAVTTPLWAGETHMLDGYNLVNYFEVPLMVLAWSLLILGLGLILCSGMGITLKQVAGFLRKASPSPAAARRN
jgi:hypothetical protein